MKKTFLFVLSFLGVLVLAVLLSPLLYQVLPFKFGRIFNRIVMIGTLICVAVFVRIRKETFMEYGLTWKSDSLRFLVTAFLTPVLVLSAYVGFQTLFGQAEIVFNDISVGKWISKISTAFFAGFLIACIEEFFFRGAIFNGLSRLCAARNRVGTSSLLAMSNRGGIILSLAATNLFYSIVHFVSEKKPFVDSTPTVYDSLRILAAPFQSFLHFGEFWPGFVGLFIFGLMLNGLYLRTKSLYPAIGLHAGAVFFIKTDGLIVNFGNNDLIWGSGKMYDGLAGWCALGILYFILSRLLKSRASV